MSVSFLIASMLSGKGEAFHQGGYPPGYNFKSYLKALGVDECIYFSKQVDVGVAGTYCVNQQIFLDFHIVIYGNGGMTRQYFENKSLNGFKNGQWRFFGVNKGGVAVDNPNYVDDTSSERSSTYLIDNKFAYQPWDANRHPNLIKKVTDDFHKTYFPDPRKYRKTNYDLHLLGGAYETYKNVNQPGKFLSVNKHTGYAWLKADANGKFYNYTNNNLSNYASMFILPTEYTSGIINMYREASSCSFGYCYATFTIAPQHYANDWIDFGCSNTMTINSSPYLQGKQVANATTNITLNGTNKSPQYKATITYHWEGSSTKYTKDVTMKVGQTLKVDLKEGYNTNTKKNEILTFPASGQNAKLVYSIKAERDHIETIWNKKGNNNCQKAITLAPENNASVSLKANDTKYEAGSTFNGTFTVKNDFTKEIIDAPTSTALNHARLHSATTDSSVINNGNNATVRIYKGSELLETTSYSYTNLAKGKSKTISVNSDYAFELSGQDYKAVVCIPVYYSVVSAKDETASDNCHTQTFAVTSVGDVSVTINGNDIYEIDSDISLRYTLNNDFPKTHATVPITVKIINDNTGKVVKTLNITEKNVKTNTTVYGNTEDFTLPSGSYRADISIPHYPGESNYKNNSDSFSFLVRPFIPGNVECKVLDSEHVKVLEGDKAVSKFCIGQTPNYPSTRVEEGQGTMFFVMYRILPTPLPAYEVTNLDESGMYQTYTLKEESDEKGMDNTFIHFPTDRNNEKNLKGPYTAGPHEFYHYLYRGRMLPSEVTFDIKVSDPNGKEIPAASGEVFYKIDQKKCFDEDQIDIQTDMKNTDGINALNPCGQIFFYLPKEPTDDTVFDMQNLPGTDELLHFANPGVHTFDIKANEKQVYVYQRDDGAEMQGNESEDGEPYLRSPWKSESLANAKGPVNTNTIVNDEWIIQDSFENHCYSDNDAFDRVGQWVGTDFNANNNQRNECYHNHGSEWHYWEYNWSKPTIYGDMDRQ